MALHDPVLPTLAPGQALALARTLSAAMPAWGDETLWHRTQALMTAISENAGLDGAVERLVGLGPGLTPSGDDFLAGMLAALQSTDEPGAAPLGAAISRHLDRTTLLSRHFLMWGVQRRYGETIRSVFASAGGTAAVEALLTTGATSGADTAAGICAGLNMTYA